MCSNFPKFMNCCEIQDRSAFPMVATFKFSVPATLPGIKREREKAQAESEKIYVS